MDSDNACHRLQSLLLEDWMGPFNDHVMTTSDLIPLQSGVGKLAEEPALDGQADVMSLLEEEKGVTLHGAAPFLQLWNENKAYAELKRIQLEADFKNSLHSFGTFIPEHLSADFLHIRKDVVKYEGKRKMQGDAFFDTECLFDHERFCSHNDILGESRNPIRQSLLPLVCDNMRYLNRAAIIRRHSRSNVTRCLAANRKLLSNFPKHALGKAFPVHKFVPTQWDVTGVLRALPAPLLTSDGEIDQKTLSQIALGSGSEIPSLDVSLGNSRPYMSGKKSLEECEIKRKGSSGIMGRGMSEIFEATVSSDQLQKLETGSRSHFFLDNEMSIVDTKESNETIPRAQIGRIARLKVTTWIEDAVANEMQELMGGRLKGLNSRKAQLRSRRLLETTNKSLRLIRHQLNEEYLDSLRFLYRSSAVPGGIQSMREMLWYLGSPDKRFSAIIVAGSFGKTIVASKIAAGLSQVGLKVGLFISPHLATFRERISITGQCISKSEVIHLVDCIRRTAEACQSKPTFFECATLMALCHFFSHGCEYVVLESGEAGGGDPVRSVSKVVCTVITGVTSQRLPCGKSAEDTARRYLSFVQPRSILVLGPTMLQMDFIMQQAKRFETIVTTVGFELDEDEDTENIRIAEAVLTSINVPIPKRLFSSALCTRPFLRYQRLSHRDRNIAARHVHYFLKCAYNMTRALHMQWRAIAVTHCELFANLRLSASGEIEVVRKTLIPSAETKTQLREKAMTYDVPPSRSPSSSHRIPLQRQPSELARAFDEIGRQSARVSYFRNLSPVVISRTPGGSLIQRALRSWGSSKNSEEYPSDRQDSRRSDRFMNDPLSSFSSEFVSHLQSSDQLKNATWSQIISSSKDRFDTRTSMTSLSKSSVSATWQDRKSRTIQVIQQLKPLQPPDEGVKLFLNFCTTATEVWPLSYHERLPFKNWVEEYREWSKSLRIEQVDRVEQEQQWRQTYLHQIENCAYSMAKLMSFLHFAAFKNEALYWNFAQLLQLRESGSPYVRHPDWMKHKFSSTPNHITLFGRTPSTARVVGTAVKARIKRDETASLLIPTLTVLPTPTAIVINITPNEYAFERLFKQFKRHYPSTSVRICVALDDEQPVHILNPSLWILNHSGADHSRPRTEVEGIHILDPEHFRAKRVSTWLWELATDPLVDKSLKHLVTSSLLTQIHWQLCLFPPLSPIPVSLFKFLQEISTTSPKDKTKTQSSAQIEELHRQVLKAAEVKWPGDPEKAEQNLRTFVELNPRFSAIASIFAKKENIKAKNSKQTHPSWVHRKPYKRRISRPRSWLRRSRIQNELQDIFWISEPTSAEKNNKKKSPNSVPLMLLKWLNERSKETVHSNVKRQKTLERTTHRFRLRRPLPILSLLPFTVLLQMHRKRSFDLFSIAKTTKEEVYRRRIGPLKAEMEKALQQKGSKNLKAQTFRRNYQQLDTLLNTSNVPSSSDDEKASSSTDSISSTTLRNAIVLHRHRRLKSDVHDPISCVAGQIEFHYDWALRPSVLLNPITLIPRPHLKRAKKWYHVYSPEKYPQPPAFVDLLPPTEQNVIDFLRMLKILKAPDHICLKFKQLWPLCLKLKSYVKQIQKPIINFPLPCASGRSEKLGLGLLSNLPSRKESSRNIPIVQMRRRLLGTMTNSRQLSCRSPNPEKVLLSTFPRLDIIGRVVITSDSEIENLPISIGKVPLKLGEFEARYVKFNEEDCQKAYILAIQYERFVLCLASLAKVIGAFSQTGYWLPYRAPEKYNSKFCDSISNKSIVAIPLAFFQEAISGGIWIRLLRTTSVILKTSRTTPIHAFSQRISLKRPVDNERLIERDTPRAMSRKKLLNLELLRHAAPSSIYQLAKSIASACKNEKNLEIGQGSGEKTPPVRDAQICSLVKVLKRLSCRKTIEITKEYETEYSYSETDRYEDFVSSNGDTELNASDSGLTDFSTRKETKREKKALNWTLTRKGRSAAILQYTRLLKQLQLKDICKDADEEAEYYRNAGIDFGRFSHMFRPNVATSRGNIKQVDAIQPGDLQSQLSIIFQKCAAEQSVLLVCGTPLMAKEVMLTFGCGMGPSNTHDPIVIAGPRITEEILRGWKKLDEEAFPYGYVTISPASLVRRAANTYLTDAIHTRLENERTRQSEVVRFSKEKQYIT